MTGLQIVFGVALTSLLVAVAAFTVHTVRSALTLGRSGSESGTWLHRLARTGRHDAQRWAFVAHRATGVAVFAFLLLHVFDVALYAVSPTLFDEVHSLYGTVPLRLFECALLVGILFHTFNGLRLVALDILELSAGTAHRLLHVAVGLSVAIGVPASIVILLPVLS